MAPGKPTWQELVADKRARQKASIPKEWLITPQELPKDHILDVSTYPEKSGLLDKRELEITNTPVYILLERLASGTWSSVEVTKAFANRAIIAHQLTNCLTEIFIEKALDRAGELDEHLKKTGKVVGPLHGLPVSLKDQLNVKGIETTLGYATWIGKYAKENAVLVDILLDTGAVLYVRTNVPQTLMWPETLNHVFGRTVNPHNRSLTCGGSSGGEGALIAMGGSPLGVGSDVGASIRVPAAFCGIYGMKPSSGRTPYAKAANSLDGQDSVQSVFGPMSSHVSGLKIFMKAVIDAQPWLRDPLAIKKPWNEDEYNLVEHGGGERLCFGIMWHDEVVMPDPPVIRALQMTKKALEKAGHRVIEWKAHRHAEIQDILNKIWAAGSTEDYKATVKDTDEPQITTMNLDQGSPRKNSGESGKAPTTAYQLWQLHRKKRDLRQEYLERWGASSQMTGTGRPIDALICPVAAYAAPPHGMNRSVGYTMVFNVLDYPTIVVPVTRVDQDLDLKGTTRGQFLGEKDKKNYEFYDPKKYENAPVGIQVVGRTLEDEAVIAMAEIVDKALHDDTIQAKL